MTQMVQKSYKKVRFCYQETILVMEKTLRFRSLREGKTQQGTKHEEKKPKQPLKITENIMKYHIFM